MALNSPVSQEKQNKKQIPLNNIAGLIAVAALLLGIWTIGSEIKTPFDFANTTTNSQTSDNNEIILQNQDTDGDGLSDYDEINVYKTSAYLKDSDSDGIDDRSEIDKGTDPNCPEGKNCSQAVISNDSAGLDNSLTQPDLTPNQIRELLKQNGLTDEVLAKYDDATLVKIYKEVAGEVTPNTTQATSDSESAPTSTLTPPSLTDEQKQKIIALPPADLRKYLLDAGAEPDILQKMDDTMLITLVKQVLGL